MNFSVDQLKKAQGCKSVDELIELAKTEGIEMAKDEAEKYFAQLQNGELNLNDMMDVAGGACVGNACAQC